jgi:isopentenyl-diphosphate delta-isomerase
MTSASSSASGPGPAWGSGSGPRSGLRPREGDLVELVSSDGRATGSTTVLDAHTAPGQLHRAFSVLLFDPAGRTLLQQRAAVKTRFPLRWANACCGHPAPGAPVAAAAATRLAEELGVSGVTLAEVGRYTYQAADPETGLVEHEYDHVLVARVPADLVIKPDPAEVAQVEWVPGEALLAAASDPAYAPWLAGVLPIALGH